MAGVDYSAVAGVYRWLEFCVFGSGLQDARVGLLDDLLERVSHQSDPRVLLVGDGDGRFLEELLLRVECVRVDYVDCSEGMMLEAQGRVGLDDRVSWACADLFTWEELGYEVVVAHFLLDGFSGEARRRVIERLVSKLRCGGLFLVSDFDSRASFYGRVMVCVMQVFFRMFAQVPFVDVCRADAEFEALRGLMVSEKSWRRGWIYTQLWHIS